MYGSGLLVPEFTHISVLTESGTEYLLRFHEERMYVSRRSEVNVYQPPEAALENFSNRVSDEPVAVEVGEPMDLVFRDSDWLGVIGMRTSRVAAYHETEFVDGRVYSTLVEADEY